MIISQRDPRWSGIKLGTSSTSIGSHGCTISCLGYMVGKYPDYVNTRMNAVGGYDKGNLVIWSKVKEAIGAEAYRYTSYDNAKVLEAISLYGGCLVEVDAKVIGGTGKHWVVFTGNKKAQDPWFGAEKNTSDYSPSGYAIIKVNKVEVGKYMATMYKGLDLTNQDSMKVAVDIWDDVINKKLYTKVSIDEYSNTASAAAKYTAFLKAGWETPQVVSNIIDDFKKELERWKLETSAAQTEAEARRQDYKTILSSLAEILGTRQDANDIINQATVDKERSAMVDDVESAHKADKEGWSKKEIDFKGEIARLTAIAEQRATLGDYATSDIIKELIRRFSKIMDLGR